MVIKKPGPPLCLVTWEEYTLMQTTNDEDIGKPGPPLASLVPTAGTWVGEYLQFISGHVKKLTRELVTSRG